jgi:hypothetical protein
METIDGQVELPQHQTIEELTDICDKWLALEDTIHLDSYAKEQSSIYFKVQRLLAVETNALDFFNQKLLSTELQLRRYYDGKFPPSVYRERPLKYPPSNQKELDLCVKCDPMYHQIDLECTKAKRRVEFLENVLWRIKERGSEIRTIMDWRKYIEAGI